MQHVTQRLEFTNRDGLTLAGRLELPNGRRPRAFALFAHCFTCSKDVAAASRVSRELAAQGFGVLRFDFTGLGNSEGDFANTNFSSNVADLVDAARFVGGEQGPVRLLVGHSLGGAAVLAAAHDLPEVEAVATIGAPSEPAHVQHLLEPVLAELREQGEAQVALAGRPFRIKQQFVDDLERHGLKGDLGELRQALLVMHSPTDDTVGIEHARALYEHARHPKSFVSLDGADHLLTRAADARFVGNLVASWAERYVTLDEHVPEDERLPDGVVQVTRVTGYEHTVRARGHELAADEPTTVGGSDQGPAPYEYLLGSLGSCTAMTMEMYAGRKGWDLGRDDVKLKHSKAKAAERDDVDTDEGFVDVFERDISIEGNLDDEQRARLLEIANKCPVHRTLTENQRVVETRLAD
ncbi:MAG: bifunctional alpha/beta hydrolase/OsmC family protein [Planctomycetota bacterium]